MLSLIYVVVDISFITLQDIIDTTLKEFANKIKVMLCTSVWTILKLPMFLAINVIIIVLLRIPTRIKLIGKI